MEKDYDLTKGSKAAKRFFRFANIKKNANVKFLLKKSSVISLNYIIL